ncbi:MAG: hypothetical protein JW822_09520 [Spirochaetales bacterium]|nr:hypothetical protein [Spirochaetales bacterium]
MKKFIYGFMIIIYCLCPLFSEFHYIPPLEFSIPDNWKAEEQDGMSVFTSPDGEFFIYVWQIKGVTERKNAVAGLETKINHIITDFEIKMEEELSINQLFVYVADGDGFLGQKDVGVSVAVVEADTNVDVSYYILLFTGTNEGWHNHWKRVNETIESVTCEREGG